MACKRPGVQIPSAPPAGKSTPAVWARCRFQADGHLVRSSACPPRSLVLPSSASQRSAPSRCAPLSEARSKRAPGEIRSGQDRPLKVRVGEEGALKVGLGEDRRLQVGATQDGSFQVGFAEVGTLEVGVNEVGAAEIDLVQVQPGRQPRLGIGGLGEGATAKDGQGGLQVEGPGSQFWLAVRAVQRPIWLIWTRRRRRRGCSPGPPAAGPSRPASFPTRAALPSRAGRRSPAVALQSSTSRRATRISPAAATSWPRCTST
jgi:hypothetical protein